MRPTRALFASLLCRSVSVDVSRSVLDGQPSPAAVCVQGVCACTDSAGVVLVGGCRRRKHASLPPRLRRPRPRRSDRRQRPPSTAKAPAPPHHGSPRKTGRQPRRQRPPRGHRVEARRPSRRRDLRSRTSDTSQTSLRCERSGLWRWPDSCLKSRTRCFSNISRTMSLPSKSPSTLRAAARWPSLGRG
jgi:hypothetical protein